MEPILGNLYAEQIKKKSRYTSKLFKDFISPKQRLRAKPTVAIATIFAQTHDSFFISLYRKMLPCERCPTHRIYSILCKAIIYHIFL